MATAYPERALRHRKAVLWIGPAPDSETRRHYDERNLTLTAVTADAVEELLPSARAVIFAFDERRPGTWQSEVPLIFEKAISHGVLVGYDLPPDKSEHFRLAAAPLAPKLGIAAGSSPLQAGEEIIKHFEVKPRTSSTFLPEEAARHDPGPPFFESVTIGGETEKLNDEARTLVIRAFDDCADVYLRRLGGGRSGADAYSVHVTFDGSQRSQPLPFFAKIGPRGKIEAERRKYRDFAHHHVPFQYRPNLELRRFLLGATQGILVGNFVEEAEVLWSRIQAGSARVAIYSLFDEALRGWWQQSLVTAGQPVRRPLWDDLKGPLKRLRRIPHRTADFARQFGATRAPDQLLAAIQQIPPMAYRRGQTHGDLHARNIMVTGNHSFVIDFLSACEGPLVSDPACLEAFAAFEVPDGERPQRRDKPLELGESDDDTTEHELEAEAQRASESAGKYLEGYRPDSCDQDWISAVNGLYQLSCLTENAAPQMRPFRYDWLWSSVRAIRSSSRTIRADRHDYCLATIMHLLRRSAFRAEFARDAFRRAYAYATADRLLAELSADLRSP